IRDKLVTGVQTCALPILNQLAVAANQFFESLQLPTLRLGYQSSVRIVHSCERGGDEAALHGSVSSRRKMHFILFQDEGGLKIWLDRMSVGKGKGEDTLYG